MRSIRYGVLLVALVLGLLATNFGHFSGASTTSKTCVTSQLHLQYNQMRAGTGNVNLFFLIRNESSLSCSLRSFPGVTFLGSNEARLSISQANAADSDGNDLGGLRPGLPVPTVVLAAHSGVASFSIYGRDMPHGNSVKGCVNTRTMLTKLPGVAGTYTIFLTPRSGEFDTWCGGVTMHPIVPGRTGVYPPNRSL
jgi:hypothetical protein